MTTLLDHAPPAAVPPPARHRHRLAALALAAAAVVVAVVLLLVAPGHSSKPRRAPAATVVGVAGWFAAAGGPTCRSAAGVPALPGVTGAISCRPTAGISAAFARLASPSAAADYLTGRAGSHAGSKLTAWISGTGPDRGDVLFYVDGQQSTLLWTYTGEPYVAWASSSSPASALEQWWATAGRPTASNRDTKATTDTEK